MGLPRHDDFMRKRSGWTQHFGKFYQVADERQAGVIETLRNALFIVPPAILQDWLSTLSDASQSATVGHDTLLVAHPREYS